jgi:hypothetical protein
MTMSGSMHPSPQRHNIGLLALAVGLVGPPAIWTVQFLANYWITSFACAANREPRGLNGGVWIAVIVINLLALAAASAATWLSYRNWQSAQSEHPGTPEDLVATGEGRSRFIGFAGIISGIAFILGILFDLVSILGVPQCGI